MSEISDNGLCVETKFKGCIIGYFISGDGKTDFFWQCNALTLAINRNGSGLVTIPTELLDLIQKDKEVKA